MFEQTVLTHKFVIVSQLQHNFNIHMLPDQTTTCTLVCIAYVLTVAPNPFFSYFPLALSIWGHSGYSSPRAWSILMVAWYRICTIHTASQAYIHIYIANMYGSQVAGTSFDIQPRLLPVRLWQPILTNTGCTTIDYRSKKNKMDPEQII